MNSSSTTIIQKDSRLDDLFLHSSLSHIKSYLRFIQNPPEDSILQTGTYSNIYRTPDTSFSAVLPINDEERRFIGIASAEVIDSYGTFIELSHLKDWIPAMVERRIPISVEHTDMIPGYIENFELTTLGDIQRRFPDVIDQIEIDDNNRNVVALLSFCRIHNTYPDVDAFFWELIRTGYYSGMSVRAWGEQIPGSNVCDLEKHCGELIRNSRIVAVTLTEKDEQSNPKAVIVAKMKQQIKELQQMTQEFDISRLDNNPSQPSANNAYELLQETHDMLQTVVSHLEPAQGSSNPQGDSQMDNSNDTANQAQDENQDNSRDNQDCPDCGGTLKQDPQSQTRMCSNCGYKQSNDNRSDSSEEENNMERTKETKNPNKPCAQSGQSDITREQGAQAQSEEMVTISRTKLNQLATLAEKGLESEKRDGLLDRVDTILSGKTPSVSRSTQTQSFNTNKVDIDALLKQRLQAMSDEDLAKMNITRSQTPETQATVQQKGDTSGTSGTQGGNNQQNTQPSVPGYNDVKEYYYRNFARMPNQEEIQLHCVEGVPLPNYETVVQNVGQNIQAGVN